MMSRERLMAHVVTELELAEVDGGRTLTGVGGLGKRTETCDRACHRKCRLWGHASQHCAHTHASHSSHGAHAGRRVHRASGDTEADWNTDASVGRWKICETGWCDWSCE